MKTFTTYAEKKAKQFLNLLQGYTKGIRMTAILVLLLMGVSNASAAYYYRGNQNSWGATQMTASADGFYEYFSAKSHANNGNQNQVFKVSTTTGGWDYNNTYMSSGFNGTNITNMGSWDSDNICMYHDKDYYILVYKPNTTVNNTSKPIICAATYLPDNRECTVYFVNKDSWNSVNAYGWYYQNSTDGSNNGWPGKAMTNTGKTYNGKQIWSYTYPQTYDKAIFNNGSSKTSDLTLGTTNKGKMYDYPNSKWIDHTYDVTVTFDANGHGTAPTAKTVLKGGKVTAPTAPTATGYTFGGWYKETNCTTAFDFNTAINADITLYAKWTANKYTVTLSNQGATTAGTASVQATYGSAMPSATMPTKTGNTFGGYYTSNNGGGTQYYNANGASAKNWAIASNSTLYAKWTANKYDITYRDQNNANFSGSHASGYPTKHTYGTATTLKDATKTGYTFGGWHTDQACTQKVTSLGATAYTANITLYAKWTINQYTLTYSAGEGGSVTGPHESGAKYDYNTSVTLTATPAEGNILSQWVDENGTFVSSANQYTFNITKNTTLKAEFAPPTTVYLKPEGYWPADEARFAIYTWGAGKTDRWVEMQHVDCENQYYSANIPSGYTNFKYIRLNPAGKGNKNDGLDWDYKWNETGNLTVQKDLLYTTPRIYLKPNAYWTSDNARFAAYFFEDGKEAQWMSMYKDGNYYYCDMVDGYSNIIFCRMNPSTETNHFDNCWNQSSDQKIAGNCFTVTESQWTDGKWSEYYTTFTTPTYPLTLKATPYGEFTVKCNGVSHTSSRTKDIVINLPVGSTVEITQSTSYHDAYNNNLVIKTSSSSEYEEAELNTTYTLCGETTIEENFTTIAGHTVFLRVPTGSVGTSWNTSGANYIWHRNRLRGVVATMTEADDNDIKKESGYAYFKATVPAGHREFRFERKTAENAGATNYTEYFEHLLPLGQSNCFTLDNNDGNMFYGNWGLSTANGDYRILYVEQQVAHGTGADAWKTVINTTYQHSSDIIKKRTATGTDIVSLHINYDETKHPRIILQQMSSGKWVDVEGQAHMVLSPLTASADMAMLPGRRNAEGDANLRYGDGIEEIKADATEGKAGRVWNFVVQQSGASAHIDFTDNAFAPYEGAYYIRTDNAAGGWMTYTLPGNVMTHSDYALEHSGYSHYFCKWVETSNKPNTKFVVANEYGAAISDTIVEDKFTNEDGTLNANANVRWMWNEYTNIGSRAYIAGSSVTNFLVAEYVSTESQTKTGEFKDKGEWVYEADLENVQIDDTLTSIAATYDAQVQELLEKSHVDAGGLVMLASAENDARGSSYTVRIVYDFKINQTICYLIPTGTAVTTSIDVLIERIDQDEQGKATQVTAAIKPANDEVGLTVYGLITLTKDHITNSAESEQDALTYWISFPFDVKIGDITGFGEVGKHWMIKYYDGAERAEKGWFLDTKTFWKFFLDTENVMRANRGYVLTLNKSLLNESNPVYDNTETLRLYFPSMNKITTEINSGYRQDTVHITEHWCNITSPADRTTKDSHWNMIGVPSFANQTITTTNETVKYFYDYSHKNDTYQTAQNIGDKTFKPMHAYMVQFAGVIDWKSERFDEATKQQLAAKKNADAEEQYTLRLELQQNGTKADQTFVELHDDATTMFDMNVDLTKMFNASSANIYTLIGSDNQVAANVMPIANTTIPVGVQIAKAGEYTFAMPDGTDGVVVELIDYEYNTRTNLLFSEYTVNLPAGTNDTRFALSVKPDKTATSMENITTPSDGELRKFIIDGVLYMQKDGVLYDAQGKLVR